MVLFITANGVKMPCEKARVFRSGGMVQNTRVTGAMIWPMELVDSFTQTDLCTKDSGSIIMLMVKALSYS
jgi:hypothetical protein